MIRNILRAAALLMLTVSLPFPPARAEDAPPATLRAGAKSAARLPNMAVRADAPRETVQALVSPDGRVTPIGAERIAETGEGLKTSCPIARGGLELRGVARAIAFDEGAPPDVVVAILSVEARIRAELPAEQPDLATILPKRLESDQTCDPPPHIRAGIRRFNALRAKYPNSLQLYAAYHAGEDFLRDRTGAPTYPATLRFVVAVMNELARVPVYDTFRAPSARPQARVARDAALLRETAPLRRDAQGDPRWASGFVLNLE